MEVVIASALLVITMGALMGAVVVARRAVVVADNRAHATQVARMYMESFLTNSFLGSPQLSYGSHTISTNEFPGYPTNFPSCPSNFTGFYVVSSNSNPLFAGTVKDINITLRWVNPGITTTSSVSFNGSFSSALHP